MLFKQFKDYETIKKELTKGRNAFLKIIHEQNERESNKYPEYYQRRKKKKKMNLWQNIQEWNSSKERRKKKIKK